MVSIHHNIELDDLSQSRKTKPEPNAVAGVEEPREDNTVVLWAWCSAVLLFLSSLCLILFPRFVLFFAETSTDSRITVTPLERFLALHFGIWLAAISVMLILNVFSPASVVLPKVQQSAYADHPLLRPLTVASGISAILSYNTKDVGSLASIVFVGSGVMSLWGLWAVVFAGPPLLSKKTGADKHTSTFLFGNKSAASIQKKEWKRRQNE